LPHKFLQTGGKIGKQKEPERYRLPNSEVFPLFFSVLSSFSSLRLEVPSKGENLRFRSLFPCPPCFPLLAKGRPLGVEEGGHTPNQPLLVFLFLLSLSLLFPFSSLSLNRFHWPFFFFSSFYWGSSPFAVSFSCFFLFSSLVLFFPCFSSCRKRGVSTNFSFSFPAAYFCLAPQRWVIARPAPPSDWAQAR